MATNQIPVTLTPTPEVIPAELAPILRGEKGIPGDGMPAGGTEGQVLAKASADDFDLEWVNQTGGGGTGATNLAYTASPTGGTVTSDTGTDATIPLADGTNAGLLTPAEKTKLSNTSGTNTGDQDLSGYSLTSHNHSGTYQPLATVLTNTTASFTSAQETKLGHISVTQAVDLDAIESRVNDLDAAVVLKGVWDASAGAFPGAGAAQAGWSYIASAAGTVDGTAFAIGDRAIAITDNASTSTLAGNWFKADYTDQVLSVAGRTGAVTLTSADLTDTTAAGRALLDDATAADQRTTLGLGDSSTKAVGTTAGTVAAGDHSHDALYTTIAAAASRSSKDANGIWTTVQYRRADNTLIRQSVLSGGTSPEYTTRTETVYAADGTTVLSTLVYTLTYTSGELTSEDLA